MSKADDAKQLFMEGANCAQAVFCVFAEEQGMDRELALKLSSGFGGGMGRMREVCGAVSGMIMAADLIFAKSDLKDKAAKDEHYALIQKLAGRFKEENGSIICRELLGLPGQGGDTPVSEVRTAAYYKKRPCGELVAIAARILEEEIDSRG